MGTEEDTDVEVSWSVVKLLASRYAEFISGHLVERAVHNFS